MDAFHCVHREFWYPRPDSNRHDLAIEGFSYHFGFRRRPFGPFVVWSTPSPWLVAALGARRLLSTPSRASFIGRAWFGVNSTTWGNAIRAFADFDGCHLGRFPPRAQIFKSLVSTYSTTRACGRPPIGGSVLLFIRAIRDSCGGSAQASDAFYAGSARGARPDAGKLPWRSGANRLPIVGNCATLVAAEFDGGGGRNRTGLDGFAIRCITSLPPRPVRVRPSFVRNHAVCPTRLMGSRHKQKRKRWWLPYRLQARLERETRLELATSTLARLRSTN